MSLDLGLSIRHFNAAFIITEDLVSESVSAAIPMLYGAARFDLPLSGAYALGELMVLSVGDSSLQDAKVAVAYQVAFRLGGELSYRQNILKVDDVDDCLYRWYLFGIKP